MLLWKRTKAKTHTAFLLAKPMPPNINLSSDCFAISTKSGTYPQKVVGGTSTSEVMQLVLVTQYFDTIKSIGEMDKTNTLFLSHSPGAVKDISEQVLQSMLIAERAKA